MAKVQVSQMSCPLCGGAAPQGRCGQCGADLRGESAWAIAQADAGIAGLSLEHERITRSWNQWLAYRAWHVARLTEARDAARAADPFAGAPAQPLAAVAAVPVTEIFAAPPVVYERQAQDTIEPQLAPSTQVAADPVVAPTPLATPTESPQFVADPVVAPTPQFASSPSPHGPGDPVPYAEPAVTAQPQRERRASAAFEALTAPALLGVAGASLLVAAAIVFVALAWTSFSPVARGSVVLAVGVLVAGIAVWVKRLGLVASSGAIGVVAMGFAGVATIAYLRDSGVVGSFDAAAALLIAGLAGLLLSRFGIPWVGSAAALSMAASVASFTFAATATADRSAQAGGSVGAMPIWIVAGTSAASALAASHRLWRWTVAKSVVAWASVVWLAVVGISVPIWIWGGDGGVLEAALGFLPIVALAIIATRWKLLATGPAAFLFTIMVPAVPAALGLSFWIQAAASAAAVAGVLALGRWLPRLVLRPLFIGVAPAFIVVAGASAGYAMSITVGRIIAGTYVPDTQLWAGVAALLCGLAIATLRLWRLEWTALRVATPVGAAMVAFGAGITAFGVAELTGSASYHSSVAIALVVAAAGLVAMLRVWWDSAARLVTEVGILAFLVTASVHAFWALVIGEFGLPLTLAVVAAPLVVFALRVRTAPWWSLPFLVAGITAVAPAIVAFYAFETAIQGFALVASASVVAWTAWRLPRGLHPHAASGLVPALTVGVLGAVASVLSTVATLVASSVDAGRSAWWDASALALAMALATWNRWHLPSLASRAVPVTGAVVVLASAAGFAVSAAGTWGVGLEGAVPLWVLVAAVAVFPVAALWQERTAAWVNGVGSAALAALAGFNALGYVAVPWNPPWLPLGVAVGAIAVLAIGSVRWPAVALAPAIALATGLGLVLPIRADATVTEAIAVAAAVGAAAIWLPLRGASRGFAAVGAAPALAGGVVVALTGVWGSVLTIAHLAPARGSGLLDWFSLLALAATALALLCVPRIVRGREASGRQTPWGDAAMRAAAWALVATGLASLVVVTVYVSGLSWLNPSVAAIARTVTATLAAGACAALYSAVARGALAPRLVRRTVRVGAMSWIAVVAVVAGAESVWAGVSWQASAASFAIAIVALTLMATVWRRAALAALVAVCTATPLVLVAAQAVTAGWGVAIGAGIGAGMAWLASSGGAHRVGAQDAIRWGLVPAAIVAVPVAVTALLQGAAALGAHVFVIPARPASAWWLVTLAAVVIGLLSEQRLRRFWTLALAGTAVLTLSMFGAVVAALVLAAGQLLLLWLHKRVPFSAKAATILGAGALAWATHEWVLVALVAASGAASGIVVLRRRRVSPPAGVVVATPVLAALSMFAAALATDSPAGASLAAPLAMVALLAAGAGVWLIVPGSSRPPLPITLIAATALVPFAGDGLAASGMTLLIASVGWFALTTQSVEWAKWYAAAAASLGVGLVAFDAGVTAIEAYTLAPAACALALGAAWMRTSPETSSLAALSPGLAVALVPSYLALVSEPDNLARTVWLTVVMVALALVGMGKRWFAPVAATAVTAILVAVLQLVVGSNLVLRLVAFLIVGTLLLVAASLFDKIKTLR